jgi:hypothetical protein
MANSISAELAAVREELAALAAIVTEVLESVRPAAVEVLDAEAGEVLPAITDEAEVTGVKFVDGQLVDVPKGKGK